MPKRTLLSEVYKRIAKFQENKVLSMLRQSFRQKGGFVTNAGVAYKRVVQNGYGSNEMVHRKNSKYFRF